MQSVSNHIVELLSQKNDKAIDLIYEHYAPNLYGFLCQMLGDETEAQDVLQESLIKIWNNAGSYDAKKSKLFTWLMAICRHAAIDRLRKRKKNRTQEIQNSEINVDNNTVENNPDHLDLAKHLMGIEEKYREVITLLFFRGYTHREASDELDLPLGTVKTRLKIALRELNKIYNFDNTKLGLVIFIVWMTG